ncbi:MAG: hypothetical protein INR71_06700, partial [Terriglobus roseus]|nr:hypothetical protein [Terriglobus roseus]
MSDKASAYLIHALNLMQHNALHRSEVDWPEVRRSAALHAAGAQTTSDTYPAIYFALTQLREHHSFLRIPDSLSGEQKREALAASQSILGPWQREAKSPPPSPFRTRTEPEGHLFEAEGRTFAWITIPACSGKHSNWADNFEDFHTYATKLHAIAAGLQASHPSGWIVDLRGNAGGNMWPMLAGIGFVLGDGVAGYFVSADSSIEWSYQHGEASLQGKDMNNFSVGPPLSLPRLPNVAVLIDSGTVSSGEAIAISFQGRSSTRFFGSHTFGLSSANGMYP